MESNQSTELSCTRFLKGPNTCKLVFGTTLLYCACVCACRTHASHMIVLLGQSPPGTMSSLRYGLVVRIPGSHPGGPGSIPGVGNLFGQGSTSSVKNLFFITQRVILSRLKLCLGKF